MFLFAFTKDEYCLALILQLLELLFCFFNKAKRLEVAGKGKPKKAQAIRF